MTILKSRFRYRACIDFVRIDFKTVKSTNAFSIKRKTGITYVKPINKQSGSAANNFSCKLYDIQHWSQVENMIGMLRSRYELESEPTISGVEVSFDAYADGASYDEMIQQVAYYYWLLANPVSENRRFTRGYKGTTQGLSNIVSMIKKLKAGGTIYIGDQRSDSQSMRIYFKTTDKDAPLPEKQHRARIEITLVNKDCPFDSVQSARQFEMSKLKDFFRFRAINENLPFFNQIVAEGIPQIGARAKRSRKEGGTRLFSKSTHADTQLNRIVYDQLRNLTKRLNSSRMRKLR